MVLINFMLYNHQFLIFSPCLARFVGLHLFNSIPGGQPHTYKPTLSDSSTLW